MMAGIAVKGPQQTKERIPRIKLQTALGASEDTGGICGGGVAGAGENGGGGGGGGSDSSAMPPFYRMNG